MRGEHLFEVEPICPRRELAAGNLAGRVLEVIDELGNPSAAPLGEGMRFVKLRLRDQLRIHRAVELAAHFSRRALRVVAELDELYARAALESFVHDVRDGVFPGPEHTYGG